jgi:peptidyl-prolyl cis-trans isomerase D
MLDRLRKGAGSWIARGLMFLLVISFAAWGIGDYLTVRTDTTVATVGDVKISADAFSREFRRELQVLQQRFGASLDAEQARRLGLPDAALGQMVDRALFDLAAAGLGLRVPDSVVREAITRNPAFHDSFGKFDRQRFQYVLANEGLSEAGFVAATRRDLVREQLAASLTAGATAAPGAVADALYRYRQERRAAEYFVVASASIAGFGAPTEAELEAFHKDNAGRFSSPELRTVAWLVMRPEDLLAEMAVSDDEIKDEYEARRGQYSTPERREVEQAVYPTEAAARAAFDMLKDGADFAAVAEKTRKLKPADLKLGKVTREQLPAAIAVPVFALPVGQVSEPLQSPLGWHLARVVAIEPATTRTLAEAKDELKRQIGLRKAADALIKVRDQLDDRLAGGASLDEAAQALNFKVQRATLDARGAGTDGKPVPDLPPLPQFLSLVFEAPEGGDPEIGDGTDGAYVALRVEKIAPSALRPLAEVRDEVIAGWQAEQRRMAAERKAGELAEALKGGGDIQRLAQDAGGAVEASPLLTRGGLGGESKLSPPVLARLFQAAKGEVVTGPAAAGDGFVVARLARIEGADPAADAAQVERIRRGLANGIADDLLAQYRAGLERRFGVNINRAAMEQAL